jgi:hypothetical protein
MVSTYTTNTHLELQGTGDNSGTWGAELNSFALTILDNVLGNVQTISLSSTDVTLTTTQTQVNYIKLTGTLTANVNVIFPAIGRTYFIANNTTGAFTVSLKIGAGPATPIQQGVAGIFVLDGTNVVGAPSFPLSTAYGGTGAANLNGLLQAGVTNTITKGFTLTPNNIGTVSSGTLTPNAANGNYQYYTNNGAHTLAAPAADSALDILVTNGPSAGAITFSGFTVNANTGEPLTTTNGNKFIITIVRINGTATYMVKALQ